MSCNCLQKVRVAAKRGRGIGPAVASAREHGHAASEVKGAMRDGVSKGLPKCGPNCGHMAMVAAGERRVKAAKVGTSEMQAAIKYRQHHIGRARAYHSAGEVRQAQENA